MGLSNFIRRAERSERRSDDAELRLRKQPATRAGRELYHEVEFLHLLYIERRRSERFGRPLCLVLLEHTDNVNSATRCSGFQQIVDQVHGAIRETDIIGWYCQNITLAIMFSDLAAADKAMTNVLGTKVSSAVNIALPTQIAAHVRLTVHLFPTKNDAEKGLSDLTFYPELPSHSRGRRPAQLLKRLIDIAGSALLLCLFAPFFVLIAAAIKVNSSGPILFRQTRVGHYGRPFSFLKFRSMYVGNDAAIHREYVTNFISRGTTTVETDGVYKITNDPRVTSVGRFLRKTSLDELPQLWNVLCGDMSLVGPRPPIPYECDCYAPWHRRRVMEAKPGITGLWQVMGRSRLSFNDMVRLDLKYARHWSLWLDFKILLRTPKAVLMGEGAY
jgi:exopolysaccharide biosynthesis polyprenyl glycosylphosphotransferase